MIPAPRDSSIREIGGLRLQLREDLKFSYREFSGQPCYIVEDPVQAAYFRVGIAEHAFMLLLDGQRTVTEVLTEMTRSMGKDAFTENDAGVISRWLIDSNLATTPESGKAQTLFRIYKDAQGRKNRQSFNPLFVKIPLGNPDSVLEAVAANLRWLLGWPFIVLWACICLSGFYHVASRWDRFTASAEGIMAPDNWLWLTLVWILLKIIHELAHGLMCRKYGGHVNEIGVMLIVFMPMGYTDTTSSWRFGSKWHRIHVAAAGIYAELLVAGIAAWIWAFTGDSVLGHFAHNAVTMAGVTTLLFNANPLMRFDGYYILSDLAEIPNLYIQGMQYVTYICRRYLLGMEATSPLTGRNNLFIKTYGLASLAWRITVTASIIVLASVMFMGAGLIAAAIGIVVWVGIPFYGFLRQLAREHSFERSFFFRFAIFACLAVLSGWFLMGLKWQTAVVAPGFIEYTDMKIVRADSPGFVRRVMVRDGSIVESGAVLVAMENPEIQAGFALADIKYRQALLRAQNYYSDRKIASFQIEQRNAEALLERKNETKERVDALEVKAQGAGHVLVKDPDSLKGVYLHPGAEIMAIVNEGRKEIRVSVAQEDADFFRAQVGQAVKVIIPGRADGIFQTTLSRMNPRASREIPHLAMTAACGGKLAVKRRIDHDDQGEDSSASLDLLVPRFSAVLDLPEATALMLRAGQECHVTFHSGRQTAWSRARGGVERWFRKQECRGRNKPDRDAG